MLFDLRGAGRRRTVQAIYLTLAVLMGGGLVLFGVGGNVGGGLLDAVKNNGGGSASNAFKKRVNGLERRVRLHPRDGQAWAELARARYQETSSGDNYDRNTGAFTAKGKQALQSVAQAWDRHVAVAKHPDPQVATLMVQAFGPNGLNDLPKAVQALEIVIDSRPKSYALFAQLAALAYAAGESRKGDLAAGKAVALAPADQRNELRSQLGDAKKQAAAGAAGAPAQGTG